MNKKKKIIILVLSFSLILFSVLFLRPREGEVTLSENQMKDLVDCLKERGVVIYGTPTCPACQRLREEFGGEEIISPIYIDCHKQEDKCTEEMKTGYVPEIQIDGRLFDEWGSPKILAEEVDCKTW